MDDLEHRANDTRYSYLKVPEHRAYRIIPKALAAIGVAISTSILAYGIAKDSKEAIIGGIIGLMGSVYGLYKHRQLDRHIDEQKPL